VQLDIKLGAKPNNSALIHKFKCTSMGIKNNFCARLNFQKKIRENYLSYLLIRFAVKLNKILSKKFFMILYDVFYQTITHNPRCLYCM